MQHTKSVFVQPPKRTITQGVWPIDQVDRLHNAYGKEPSEWQFNTRVSTRNLHPESILVHGVPSDSSGNSTPRVQRLDSDPNKSGFYESRSFTADKAFSVLGDTAGVLGTVSAVQPELAPLLLPVAAVAGIGFGVYKIGHTFDLW